LSNRICPNLQNWCGLCTSTPINHITLLGVATHGHAPCHYIRVNHQHNRHYLGNQAFAIGEQGKPHPQPTGNRQTNRCAVDN